MCIAWHQHINPGRKQLRPPYAFYFSGRNNVYLANKHFGFFRALLQSGYNVCWCIGSCVKSVILTCLNKDRRIHRTHQLYFLKGTCNGLINNMDLSKIIKGP
jgi:hypothetical protein